MRSLLPLAMAGAALAQQPPQGPAVFKSTTRLVQVSVIAQDADRKPAGDLQREDFQILDNGSPQEIRLFLAETGNAAPPPAAPPNTFTNRLAPNGTPGRGYTVILFDNNNTGFEHTARARIMALKALAAVPAGDQIAIYALWCQFQVIREFTSDRDSLLQFLTGFKPAAAGCGAGAGDSPASLGGALPGRGERRSKADPETARTATHEEEGEADALARLSNDINDRELERMADHLAGIPGRKNLIWLAQVFAPGPKALRRLIDAGVAVYPVDAIGSTVGLDVEKEEHSAPLRALAAITGGVAFYDRDDLDTGIRQAIDDGRISYTLGFYAGANGAKDPPAHRLQVRVSRPGVVLRYRDSYEIEPPPKPSKNPVADLVTALDNPANATEIGITATALRKQGRLELTAVFDLAGLDLMPDRGLWKGKAEIVGRFLSAEGIKVGDLFAETATLNLRQATYQSMLKDGFAYRREIRIPPKAVEFKLLIGNLASGKAGTLSISISELKDSSR